MLIPETYELPSAKTQTYFGVTRIARITGLDRTGVEVCSAIRPGGHVLQVTNGKGLTFEHAAAAALSEAAELTAAEKVNTASLIYGSRRQLTDLGHACVWPGAQVTGDAELLFMGWTSGTRLGSRHEVFVPAHFVYCPPTGIFLGPRVLSWNTNGLAAHTNREEAIRHGLREVIERDQLAFAFPQGWTPRCVSRRVAPPEELLPIVERMQSAGFQVELFDARPGGKNALGIPVAAALLFDKEGGPVPLTAGYGASIDFVEALRAALLEAAQSRLTDIHGAREDISRDRSGAAVTMRGWFSGPARKQWSGKRVRAPKASAEIAVLAAAVAEVGDVIVVDLGKQPLHVVRVVVPGLIVSELL